MPACGFLYAAGILRGRAGGVDKSSWLTAIPFTYYPDGSGEVDPGGRLGHARPELVAAHLALDPAWHLPASAACDALLQDLVQYRLMQGTPVPRGEGPRTAAACAAPPARTACRKESR